MGSYERQFVLQQLEQRRLLAAVFWDGGGDGINWTDPLNWSGDALPVEADAVTVDVPSSNPPIRAVDAIVRIGSLTTTERITFAGTNLELDGNLVLSTGGVLRLGDSGLSADGRGWVTANGSISGSGRIEIGKNDSGILATSSIEADIEVEMLASGRSYVRGGNWTNRGRIVSSFAGGELAVGGVPDSAGFPHTFSNQGELVASNGGKLLICGFWHTTAPIVVADTDLNLQGSCWASDIALVQRSGAGTTSLECEIALNSQTLAITTAMGPMTLQNGGYLMGPGTVTTAPGTQLTCRSGAFINDVTLAGKIVLAQFTTRTRGNVALAGTGTIIGTGGTLAPLGGWTLDMQASNGARLSSATIQGSVTVTDSNAALWVDGGLNSANVRLVGANSKVVAEGTQTFMSGSVALLNTGTKLWIRGNNGGVAASLTLTNCTIKGGPGVVEDHPDNAVSASLINKGTLRAETSGASLAVHLPGGITSTGTLQANAGTTLQLSAPLTINAGSLVANGGTIPLPAGASSAFRVTSVTISAGGTIDSADNDLVIDYTSTSPLGSWNGSAYTGITGMVAAGYSGSGLTTSMSDVGDGAVRTLGIGAASQALGLSGTQTTSWNGQTVDATAVLVKYTYAGDIDLNGELNGDDYFYIDSNVLQSGSVFGYAVGDIDLNGEINGDDYFWIDSNILAAQAIGPI